MKSVERVPLHSVVLVLVVALLALMSYVLATSEGELMSAQPIFVPKATIQAGVMLTTDLLKPGNRSLQRYPT